MEQATARVLDRYGGTQLATSLRSLLTSRHGNALRGGVLVVASDGWDSDDPELLAAYYAFWEPHTLTDPAVRPTWEALRADGIKVGVLSNTIWPRAFHERIFERDGVLDLIDGDVYTSEIAWTKPSPHAFAAAMDAVGVSDPARCVYVGDRLFDDIWGARNAGLRAVHVPHSTIPAEQVGRHVGVPDAVAHELADLPGLIDAL